MKNILSKLTLLSLVLIPFNVSAAQITLLNQVLKDSSNSPVPNYEYIENKGVYTFTENGKTVHYYRGKGARNNVLLDDMCFMIIRTTYNDGVKAIYQGKAVNGKCTATGSDSTIGTSYYNGSDTTLDPTDPGNVVAYGYLGYMTGEISSTFSEAAFEPKTDSIIKRKVDDWFKKNMVKYQDLLEDVIFCNEKELSADSKNNPDGYTYHFLSTYDRKLAISGSQSQFYISTGLPILTCTHKRDAFTVKNTDGNGKLTYPVALMTKDEAFLAGGSDSYVKTESSWTLTPVLFDPVSGAGTFFATIGGSDGARIQHYVNPVVAFNKTVVIKKGDGTETNPYVIGKPDPETTTTTVKTTEKTTAAKKEEVKPVPTGVYDYLWAIPFIAVIGWLLLKLNKVNKAFKE